MLNLDDVGRSKYRLSSLQTSLLTYQDSRRRTWKTGSRFSFFLPF